MADAFVADTSVADSSAGDGPAESGADSSEAGCGNTQSDMHNCGVCGHDCLGGSCSAGVCQPVAIAAGAVGTIDFYALGGYVYWLETGGIYRVPVTGGTKSLVADLSADSGNVYPTGFITVTTAGVYYYVTDSAGYELMLAPLDGSTGPSIAIHRAQGANPGSFLDLANDGASVFWASSDVNFSSDVQSMAVGGSTPATIAPLLSSDTAPRGFAPLTVDTDTIAFFSETSGGVLSLVTMPKAGGALVSIATGSSTQTAVPVLAGSDIYWSDSTGGSHLVRAPKTGGSATAIPLVNLGYGNSSGRTGVADATNIYTWYESSDNKWTIGRVPLSGGTPDILWQDAAGNSLSLNNMYIAQDAVSLFLAGPSIIYRLAK